MSWYEVDETVKQSALNYVHKDRIENGMILCMEWLLYVERTEQRLKNEQLEEDAESGKQRRFWTANIEVLDEERPEWLRILEKSLLIPGFCMHMISEALQIPQIEKLHEFLSKSISQLEQTNQERFV
jgi:hypothetical protein